MGAIYRRELGSFFNSAIGTLFLPLMLMPRSKAIYHRSFIIFQHSLRQG